MLGKSDRNILRAGAPWFAPGIALDYLARHAIDFWLTTEDLPHPENRVTVDRQGRIHLAKTYHNLEPHKRLLSKLKELMGPLGCHDARGARLVGARPADPARRRRAPVRDGALRHRPADVGARRRTARPTTLDNLYVVDTSFFPSSSAVNPALTAMANALRVGDHLARPPRRRRERRARRAPQRDDGRGGVMSAPSTLAANIGTGLVAGLAGTAAMTVSSSVEARLRGRAPSSAPARATAKVLGIKDFETDLRPRPLQRPLALGLRHGVGRRARPARRGRPVRPRRPRPPTARRSTAPRR